MTPFAKPQPALFHRDGIDRSDPQPVAVIALDDAEFLAVDLDGRVLQAPHSFFRFAFGEITAAAWTAEDHLGS